MKFLVDIEKVAPYTPGERIEAVAERYGLDEIVKLASNEYPLPPVEGVMNAIETALRATNRYPDARCAELREALAALHGVRPTNVAIGNGSLEVLLLLGEALLGPGREAVFPAPSFSLYRKMCDLHGALARPVPLVDDRLDLTTMAAMVTPATAMVILCNPNNPTGTYVPALEIGMFVEAVPEDVLVVVDEAYNEFVTAPDSQSVLALVRERPNVLVTRTFSKIYGLCALRIGYGLASEIVCRAIDTFRQPFNVNGIAQAAALESLRHQDEISRRRMLNAGLRDALVAGLEGLGLSVLPSEANFVLADLRPLGLPDAEVCERLMGLGAIVRDGAAFGLPGRARISVGTEGEIAFLIAKMTSLATGRGEAGGG
jgi:histidinol-phosphate aminotransferase